MKRDGIFLAAALLEALDDYDALADTAGQMNTGGIYLRLSVYERQDSGGVTHEEMCVPVGFGLSLLPLVKQRIQERLAELGVVSPEDNGGE